MKTPLIKEVLLLYSTVIVTCFSKYVLAQINLNQLLISIGVRREGYQGGESPPFGNPVV